MNVLIADKFPEQGQRELTGLGCQVTFNPELKDDALRQALFDTGAEIVIVRSTRLTAEILQAASALKLIVRAGSGVDTIDVESATARNIRVCNCPGMNSVAVAELVLGLMVALDRRIVEETQDLRRGVWNKKKYSQARGLKGSTLGIVGLGRIGSEVAKRAYAFDMRLIYCDEFSRPDLEEQYRMSRVSFEDVLVTSDFITVHVPGGNSTHHLIGAPELASMKPTAFVLNCSRGGVIDQAALADALQEGKLGGAALDVYEHEPGATDADFKDPIADVPGVLGTHHVGASTQQAQLAVAEEAVRIVQGYKDSKDFINCVNPTTVAPT